jgi:hypothetical protein
MYEPAFSPRAIHYLEGFCRLKDDLPEMMTFCSINGGLLGEMEQFVRSLGRRLTRDFALHGWEHNAKADDEEGWVKLSLFPPSWKLAGVGEVSVNVGWYNPFTSHQADRYFYVELRAPRQRWRRWEKLKKLVARQMIANGFTDRYDAEDVDPDSVFWKYVRFDQFVSPSGFDEAAYVQAIVDAFQNLLQVKPAIDEFLGTCAEGDHTPQEIRDLCVVAFLDTETTGTDPNAELTELAIVNTACDPITGEILGVLDEYDWRRDQRTETAPNENKIQALLTRAECIVAHNGDFDRRMLAGAFPQREHPWIKKLNWKCSLNDIKWESEVGTSERKLEALMVKYGVQAEQAHHALPDALGLLELMARRHAGKTLLADLLGW